MNIYILLRGQGVRGKEITQVIEIVLYLLRNEKAKERHADVHGSYYVTSFAQSLR